MDNLVVNKEDNGGEHVTFMFSPDTFGIEIHTICYGTHYSKIGFGLSSESARELAHRLLVYADKCKVAEDINNGVVVEEPIVIHKRPRKGYGKL